MTRRRSTAPLALLLLAASALTSAAQADPRYAARPFIANEIVTLHARPGIESAVAFAPDERIENIAVGNSTSWDVNPNKRANVVFVKPVKAGAPHTNMTVITNERTYLFDLVSSSPAGPVYMMRFTYPDVPKPVAVAAEVTKIVAEAPRPVPQPVPAALNFAWRAAGEKRLLPLSCFDDGTSTFLHWSSELTLPAILVRGPDGTEGPVNYTAKGDTIIVDGVPAQLVLRSGKQIATLTPEHRPVIAHPTTASAEALAAVSRSGRVEP